MIFLPAVEKLLREAFADPAFTELVDAFSDRRKHINLTGMTETQKAYLIAAATLWRSENDSLYSASGAQEDPDRILPLQGRPIPMILVSDELSARKMKSYLDAFFDKESVILRGRETPLTAVSASSREIEQGRIDALIKYFSRDCGALIVTAGALLTKMAPLRAFISTKVTLKLGKRIAPEDLAQDLTYMGYTHTREVEGKGEFSRRGDIFDFFPSGSDMGVRVSFFDDEIDQIKLFNLNTQRSEEQLKEYTIYPASELLLPKKKWDPIADKMMEIGEEAATKAACAGADRNSIDSMLRMIGKESESLRAGGTFSGWEKWVDILLPDNCSILHYVRCMGDPIYVDEISQVRSRMDGVAADFQIRFHAAFEKGLVPSACSTALHTIPQVFSELDIMQVIAMAVLPSINNGLPGAIHVRIPGTDCNSFRGHEEGLAELISERNKKGQSTYIMSGTGSRAEKLRSYLFEKNSMPVLLPKPLPNGFIYPTISLIVIGTQDIFGVDRGIKKKKKGGMTIDLFSDLVPGELVVDDENGVGRYDGLVNLEVEGTKRDYLMITYANDDHLYIPMDRLDHIQKYVASEGKTPKLARLGSSEWGKSVNRAKNSIKQLAFDLVELYAKRQAVDGYAFSPDTVWQAQFEDDFPYQETEDQLHAISEIKKDMESSKSMDRLLCGDVGFGKTEVAFRAIFKCVMDGKQAILLAPTTVLVQQHYDNLKERLRGYPIKVALLSRFATPKELKKAVTGINDGSVDVIVGTHRALSKDVQPKNLGLLVIDEEQRFGVNHKEKMKNLRNAVDVLTLTATPIPRTLHMSMSGIRDISVLEEPPQDRRPVQTYVIEYDPQIVAEACLREIERHGQVFYLFNNTHHIEEKAAELQEMLPGARIVFAHGKMSERELESIIESFIRREADILVCTTIIESGVDMPNVNTIIVENSDRFGLSQLYQLKGRVGRSDRQAYAYITYEPEKVLKEDAEKRLAAIRDFTELGSGIKIAMKDLEVRGAGNLLGAEQHGHMDVIGYELYCRMLDEEIKKLSGTWVPQAEDTVIKMNEDAYISPAYIPDDGQRMDVYRRIRTIETSKEKDDFEDELLDRFGDVPREVTILSNISIIRHQAGKLGFGKVEIEKDVARLYYRDGASNGAALLMAGGDERFAGHVMVYSLKNPFLQYKPAPGDREEIVANVAGLLDLMGQVPAQQS
ncbi:MAG: transcription-repair coupling factor [Clostridiales bacterium]|nr:transcription-repair coupling factor [Clostridiales bacterium]